MRTPAQFQASPFRGNGRFCRASVAKRERLHALRRTSTTNNAFWRCHSSSTTTTATRVHTFTTQVIPTTHNNHLIRYHYYYVFNMVKLLALSTVRTGNELPDPVICSFAAELSSFGFFQRTVGILFVFLYFEIIDHENSHTHGRLRVARRKRKRQHGNGSL